MYLQALTLRGFKSFADNTTLRFEPGVTAVVGPNGCGKSNIADAIRWVLGEQSAKALRGGKMQDVIFEGADTRKPAQLCEVSLLLTDCEKQLGSEFHQIEIMRRVHRDGQGEYFFNGQPCRLKDIQKLFMDTGIGRTSYSIMAQGQIDQILSSKPEERRAVFEEAAGITKYKSQRREALNKLALTDQNLARVTDIVGEVSRQIGSLRRQASKAMRFKRLNHRLRHLSLAWSGHQHGIVFATLGDLEASVNRLRDAASERRTSLEGQQLALESKKTNRSRLNQKVQEAQQAVFDLKTQREQAENAARLADIRRTGLEERIGSSKTNLAEVEMQLKEVTAQFDTGAQDKQLQLNLLGSSDAVFQQRNRDLSIIDGKVSKLEQELQQAKFELLQTESTVARLRTDCSGYEVEQKTSVHRHESIVKDMTQVKEELAVAIKISEEAANRLALVTAEKAKAQEQATTAQVALTEATREFREGQRRIQELDRQLAQRSARLKVLQQLQERWEGFGEGAKAVLQGKLTESLEGQKATPVLQGLDVRPDGAKALSALLGSAAEAIDVADVATAKRILAKLESDQIGSVILRINEIGIKPDALADLPAGLQTARMLLKDPDQKHPAVALLDACYIVDDLGSFLDTWRANPALSFLAVATRKGEVVDRRGLVTGGHASAKNQANSLVQREVDLRETARALNDEQKAHDEQRAKIDVLNAAVTAAEQAIEIAREAVLLATQNAASSQAEQRNAQRNSDDVASKLRRMEAEVASLQAARNEAHTRWVKAQDHLKKAEETDAAQRARISKLDNDLVAGRTERDVKRESLAQARLELADRRQKVEVLDRGLGEMERRRQQLAELLSQRQIEIESWSEQTSELEKETGSQKIKSSQLVDTLVVAQQQVEAIKIELVSIESEIDALEASQTKVRQESDAAHTQLSSHEIKFAENKQRAQFLSEDVTREYGLDISTVDWKRMLWKSEDEPEGVNLLDIDEDEDQEPTASVKALPAAGDDVAVSAEGAEVEKAVKPRRKKEKARGEATETDLAAMDSTNWEDIKAQVDALRQRISTMGAVNLVAIEEYVALKERHDFLKGQSTDLTSAKTELLAAIDEINKTSQAQFALTFEQIKKNFDYTFKTLFGGGNAQLDLIATEDILESGIEIVAQPPGTKLKGITLLSGGQKTLTAVALLFALYMVKPSPFCLLDELDAPLDESNIGRFTELLKKFVSESQFIIITHNKRTVAAASAIYGVTMEERGVSKIVSMVFNSQHGEPEAASRNIAESVVAVTPGSSSN